MPSSRYSLAIYGQKPIQTIHFLTLHNPIFPLPTTTRNWWVKFTTHSITSTRELRTNSEILLFDIYSLLTMIPYSYLVNNQTILPMYLHPLYFDASSGQQTMKSFTIGFTSLPERERSMTRHQL